MWETEKYLVTIITFSALAALIVFLVSIPSFIYQPKKTPVNNMPVYSYPSPQTVQIVTFEGKVPIKTENPKIVPISTQVMQFIMTINNNIKNCVAIFFQFGSAKQ
jgi:hypothetical protein